MNKISKTAAILGLLAIQSSILHAQGTAFTYQGRLNSDNGLAGGSYDLKFAVYDTNAPAGILIAGPVTNAAVAVSNGLFAVTLDFGAGVFTGPDRWLELAVRTNGAGVFTTLMPRQLIAPTPYAIMANSASNLLGTLPTAKLTGTFPAGLLSGVLPASNFTGTYGNPVAFNNGADTFSGTFTGQFYGSIFTGGIFTGQFIGDGSGLGNLNASQLASGTVPNARLASNVAFLNSNQTFTAQNVFANPVGFGNPAPVWPIDVLGGFAIGRFITTNSSYGSVIELRNQLNDTNEFLGAVNFNGSRNDTPGQIGYIAGNPANQSADYMAFRVGSSVGFRIQADPFGSGANNIIGGYAGNIISGLLAYGATIGGGGAAGLVNSIQGTNSTFATISGGVANTMSGPNTYHSVIGGGYLNSIQSPGSVIGGGHQNTIYFNHGVIGGGEYNVVGVSGTNALGFNGHATVAGGYYNQASGILASIGGGVANIASGPGSVVIGGNVFSYTPSNGTIAYIPAFGASGISSVVAGGAGNSASGDFSFAAGQTAQANHSGSFVWADTPANITYFGSTTSNEFSIRAQNGVRVQTDKGIHLNAGDEPIIVRDWDVFSTNAPASKAGIGRWGLFMEPNSLTIGIPSNDIPFRTFQVAKYATNGTYTTLMLVDQFGSVTANSFNGAAYGLTGLNPAGLISGAVSAALNLTNAANVINGTFAGDGAGLTNVNAALLGGSPGAAFAKLTSSPPFTGVVSASGLNINGNVQFNGLIRSGSETGTSNAPSLPGLVIRRVNSLNTTISNVVARTDMLTLERDGSNEGLLIRYPAGITRQSINCLAQTLGGTNVIFRTTLNNPGTAGTIQVLTSAQHAVHAEISFGNTYNSGHLTKVSLDRYDDGVTSDTFLVGTLTSTYNQ